ncbi:uncharacterized protein LOC114362385 isoform X1 [Ostrinia furnacalis]|uniref:uncharacterized protein LOC114362385 isoform X1 n=1 Tax=Ostrinia furnacalis TaxID=93504 RepID=UPI00103C0DC0|nr:uncharacterized protein LOC114362385 isoform X1 [Ostrinia furnacalis]
MRGAGGVLVIAVAAIIACCGADSHQESDMSAGESPGEHYDAGPLKEEYDLLRLLQNYQNTLGESGFVDNIEKPMKRRGIGIALSRPGVWGWGSRYPRFGESTFQRRNVHGTGAFNSIGGSSLIGRLAGDRLGPMGGNSEDNDAMSSSGRGEFVPNRDLAGATQFLRNLDPIGGGNFVKKNLDHIGGPNLVKKTLDSLGGGNLVRRFDPVFSRYIRQLDSIGGGNLV